VWHWIEEDGKRSSQVQPLIKGKIWTSYENDDDDDDNVQSTNVKKFQTPCLFRLFAMISRHLFD